MLKQAGAGLIASCYQILHITEHGYPTIVIHTSLAYSKLPKITLLSIHQLSTDHLWSISTWFDTFPGGLVGGGGW